MKKIKFFLVVVAVVVAVVTGNIALKSQSADNILFLKSIIALAQNESNDCTGTIYKDEALRHQMCPNNINSFLICVSESGKCCNSDSQTGCQ